MIPHFVEALSTTDIGAIPIEVTLVFFRLSSALVIIYLMKDTHDSICLGIQTFKFTYIQSHSFFLKCRNILLSMEEFPLSVILVLQTAFLYITCVLGLVPRS